MSKYKFASKAPFMNPYPSEEEKITAKVTADLMYRVETEVLPAVRTASENKGWLEGEQYSNFQNALTFLYVLHTQYGFSPDDCINIINESNKLVVDINENKLKLHTLMNKLKHAIVFPQEDVALAKKYKTY